MLKNVLVFVLLAVPGYILVKTKFLKSEQSGVISTLLTYVGVPFLVFDKVLDLPLNADTLLSIFTVVAIALIAVVIMLFAMRFLSGKETDEKKRGMIRFCSVFSNNAFLGLPLAMAVFGDNAPAIAMLAAFGIVTNTLLFSVGIYLVSGDKRNVQWKKLVLNPTLIAVVLGVIINVCGAHVAIPEIALYTEHLSDIVTPLSMTILGMKMGSVKITDLFKSKIMYRVSFLRLVLFPVVLMAIILGLYTLFPDGPVNLAIVQASFICYATPSSSSSSAFADQFGGDDKGAVEYTLGTTILSVISIPILYWILSMLI